MVWALDQVGPHVFAAIAVAIAAVVHELAARQVSFGAVAFEHSSPDCGYTEGDAGIEGPLAAAVAAVAVAVVAVVAAADQDLAEAC